MQQKIKLAHPWQYALLKWLHDSIVALDDIIADLGGFSRKARGKFAKCSCCGGDSRSRAVCRGCYEAQSNPIDTGA